MCSNESPGLVPIVTDTSVVNSTGSVTTSPPVSLGAGTIQQTIRMPLPLPPPLATGSGGELQPPATPRALLPIDHYRLQLYQYAVAERLRYPFPFPAPLPCYPGLFPRVGLQPEEPKPQHSYIGLIAMAILSSPECKLVLSDIYQHILDHYPYFRSRGPGWRNSIRHNLSLNDCFIKAGRSANGKGHYWAVHPANVDDFRKGDFRRRKAQRKVRRHMGLAVDEEGADSPSPPPLSISPLTVAAAAAAAAAGGMQPGGPSGSASANLVFGTGNLRATSASGTLRSGSSTGSRKRQFDVASLLAPDSGEETTGEEDIDVVNSSNGNHHQHPALLLPAANNERLIMPATIRPTSWPVLPLVSHYYQALLQQARPQQHHSVQNLQHSSNSNNELKTELQDS